MHQRNQSSNLLDSLEVSLFSRGGRSLISWTLTAECVEQMYHISTKSIERALYRQEKDSSLEPQFQINRMQFISATTCLKRQCILPFSQLIQLLDTSDPNHARFPLSCMQAYRKERRALKSNIFLTAHLFLLANL